jgi:hypothetical protein
VALLSPAAAAAPPQGAATDAAAGSSPPLAEATPAPTSPAAQRDEDAAVPPPPVVESQPHVAIATRPPPLHVEYAQYGVALTAEMNIDPGDACRDEQQDKGSSLSATGGQRAAFEPCILGSGGGLSIRVGYRSPGPWYFGGAYEFTKMDSSNLYRLGIFQQLRAEMRYLPDIGYRAAPYFSAGIGGVAYGNEWGVETGGALIFGGAGVELEVSRRAVLGVSVVYRPVLLAGWRDTAGHERLTAIAQFVGLELLLEVRTELGRR